MEREQDFITQFVEAVEQARERDEAREAEAHKYDGLENKQTIIAGWKRYEDLYGAGNPRDGEAAFELLEWLYKTLQPFESSIMADYEKAAYFPLSNDDVWIGSACRICREYHAQKPISDVGATLIGGNASPKSFVKASKKGSGKPVKPIRNFILYDDKEKLLNTLRKIIGNKKNKEAILIIKAAVVAGYMIKPHFGSVIKEFGNFCKKTNYNKFMEGYVLRTIDENKAIYQNQSKYSKQEIKSAIENLAENLAL